MASGVLRWNGIQHASEKSMQRPVPKLGELGTRRLLLANIDHHLGNLLISMPVIQAFAERFEGSLDVMVDERYACLVRLLAGRMRVLGYPAQGRRRRGIRQNVVPAVIVAGMWRRHYDAVLDLYGGTRSVVLAMSALAGARIGYAAHTKMSRLYTHKIAPPPGLHAFDRYCAALQLLEDGRPPAWPLLRPPAEADQAMDARLRAEYGVEDDRPILVLHPGAGHVYRLWPAERFGRVCERLMREFGLRLIIIGTPPERPLMEQVVSAMGDSSDVRIWHLPLLELLALFTRARMILSNESGPTHLASLTELPIVTIFGPTREELWRPKRTSNVWTVRGSPCDPGCGHARCAASSQWKCLTQLSEQQVFEAARSGLAAGGLSPKGSR